MIVFLYKAIRPGQQRFVHWKASIFYSKVGEGGGKMYFHLDSGRYQRVGFFYFFILYLFDSPE